MIFYISIIKTENKYNQPEIKSVYDTISVDPTQQL